MTLTTKTLLNYLDREASFLLADLPFKNWTLNKTVEVGLEKPLTDYVFVQNGMDFVCDENDKVRSIFLYADDSRCFMESIQDLPFTSRRREVIARLGFPSKSGDKIIDPVLGEYGAWDRFEGPGYSIHVEYRLNADRINKVTLMRADVVP